MRFNKHTVFGQKLKMKNKIIWSTILFNAYLVLVILDWKNLKYFPNLLKELKRIFKKNSKHTEDNGFILIHKSRLKNL